MDNESRLPLIHVEDPVRLPVDPIFAGETGSALHQLVLEHQQPHRLLQAGLTATRTALFVGPPGVGKTLAARWVAHQLELPLIVLDLASVMSSLLGRTGENIRRVMSYAKQTSCVLLLDELDAVAKRRDDNSEVGELKRLVTVLLQEFDMWPEGSLLLAATNHEKLLDPAVWRRFEVSLRFPLPDALALAQALVAHLGGERIDPSLVDIVALAHVGTSFSDLERNVMLARRTAALDGQSISDTLLSTVHDMIKDQPTAVRVSLALGLIDKGLASQRRAHEVTGVSRDTLRKHLAKKEPAIGRIDEDA